MLVKELEKLIREIELKYKKKVLNRRTGNITMNRRGRGMDFKESRVYEYGDDTRFIDWNVSSRMGELYLKVFHEETDRTINLFLDVSESMKFKGVNSYSKFFIGFQFAAFIAMVSMLSGDKVNILLYSDKIEYHVPSIRTKAVAYQVLKKVFNFPLTGKTNHLVPLEFLKNKAVKNSVSYIISDFAEIESLSNFRSLLELHDLSAVRVFDPLEVQDMFPVFDLFYVNKLETNSGGSYNSSFNKDTLELEDFYRKNLLQLRTDSDLGKTIFKFFETT